MNEVLMHRISVTIGLWVVSCLAATIFYCWAMLIICLIGLFAIEAIFNRVGA